MLLSLPSLALWLALDLPLFEGGARPLEIGHASDDAASCTSCHAEIAAEWRGSLHAASWTDPVFQAAYDVEPLGFCRNCHAPLHRGPEPSGVAAEDGISCAVCHVRDGVVLGLHAGDAPHALRVVPELARSSYCAPCHQFGFLAGGDHGGPRLETRELQQSTFDEWKQTGATASCQDCHMPLRRGHRSHAFAASRDPAALARAVAVSLRAERTDGLELAVTLTRGDVAHAVPTGDLNRRLELRAWVGGRAPRYPTLVYARSYGDRHEPGLGSVRFVSDEARVGADPMATRTVDFEARAGQLIRWRLDYLLMPADLAQRLGVPPRVNVTTIARGSLRAP